jgi:hypothetical protein
MKMGFESGKKFDQARSQIKPGFCLAFFLFLVESARHFYNTLVPFAPVTVRIKGGRRDA